jgi:hypothetical protein
MLALPSFWTGRTDWTGRADWTSRADWTGRTARSDGIQRDHDVMRGAGASHQDPDFTVLHVDARANDVVVGRRDRRRQHKRRAHDRWVPTHTILLVGGDGDSNTVARDLCNTWLSSEEWQNAPELRTFRHDHARQVRRRSDDFVDGRSV